MDSSMVGTWQVEVRAQYSRVQYGGVPSNYGRILFNIVVQTACVVTSYDKDPSYPIASTVNFPLGTSMNLNFNFVVAPSSCVY